MDNNNNEETLQNIIANNQRIIKDVEKKLALMDKLRKTINLKKNACGKYPKHISPSDEIFDKAKKEFEEIGIDISALDIPQKASKAKDKVMTGQAIKKRNKARRLSI